MVVETAAAARLEAKGARGAVTEGAAERAEGVWGVVTVREGHEAGGVAMVERWGRGETEVAVTAVAAPRVEVLAGEAVVATVQEREARRAVVVAARKAAGRVVAMVACEVEARGAVPVVRHARRQGCPPRGFRHQAALVAPRRR